MRLLAVSLLLLVQFAATDAHGVDCDASARAVTQDLRDAADVANQAGAFRSAFEAGREALLTCPQAEPLWYAVVRTAELGFGTFPVSLGGADAADPVDAARHAADRNPKSARIVTVLARLTGTVAAAREAVALDPSYAPARTALAAALVHAGQPDQALALLAAGPDIEAAPGTRTMRAQALLAAGRAGDAVNEARRDLNANWPNAPEPFLIMSVRRDAEETLGLALLADRRAGEAVPHLRAAAGLGSQTAATALKDIKR